MEIEPLILNVIKKSDEPLSIQNIADKVKMSRQTVSKYLLVLERAGKVKMKQMGPTKVYW